MNNNNYQKQKARGIKRKYEYILSHSGKCEICGYNKNLSALEFHHKDPNEKEFQIDARRFPKAKGKIYCSRECRNIAEGKDKYPSKKEVLVKYEELKSWQKVADYYLLSRKVIQGIRKQ